MDSREHRDTRRSALVLFSTSLNKQVHILIGINGGQYTTIGGRRKTNETEIGCLIREVNEETKNVIDYTDSQKLLSIATLRKYNDCSYYFLETDYQDLVDRREEFSKATANEPESNELTSLEVVQLEAFVEKLICQPDNVPCRTELKNMILDMGFDVMKKRRPAPGQLSEFPINYQPSQLPIKADLWCDISELPQIVSVFLFNENLPAVYGNITNRGGYLTDQYFFEDQEQILFRSGWQKKQNPSASESACAKKE